jgi:hypothetical protein
MSNVLKYPGHQNQLNFDTKTTYNQINLPEPSLAFKRAHEKASG